MSAIYLPPPPRVLRGFSFVDHPTAPELRCACGYSIPVVKVERHKNGLGVTITYQADERPHWCLTQRKPRGMRRHIRRAKARGEYRG